MATHVIINARTKQVTASLDAPGEGTTIFAVDLIGDTWRDFEYFSEQATCFESSRDFTLRNRYVRAAITMLFSHFDGVVCELFANLRKEIGFKPYLPKRPEFCPLKAKIVAVTDFLRRERGITLPAIDLNLKLLRDILNHPSISKEGASGANEALLYDGTDVYGVGIDDLKATADVIDAWLIAACSAMRYERFLDTKSLCEDFTRALGHAPGPVHGF